RTKTSRTGSCGDYQQAFNDVRDVELIPGPRATAQDVEDLARAGSASFGHAAGTCKMGIDNLAVVDPELRVHGLQHLWVRRRIHHAPRHHRTDQCPDADDRRKGGAADPRRTLNGHVTMSRTLDVPQHLLPDFFRRETNEGANPVGGILWRT